MLKRLLLSLLFLFFGFFSLINAQKLDLMKLKGWSIVVADSAISSEKYAANEFQNLFEKASGIKLSIVNHPPDKSKNIFIGVSDAMQKSNCSFQVGDLGLEGLKLKIKPDNIAIAGGRPRGTLYGIYEFAEKYLGVRFLARDYTYVPPIRPSLPVPCEEFSYKPCFEYRSVYYRENIDHPDFSVKLRNNAFAKDEKLGSNCDMQFIVHSFFRQCPVEKYGKEHPEYFAEVGGKRLMEAYGGGPQIDVSNPDVIRVMTESVIKEIEEHPEYKNVSVVHNDNEYYCRCSQCEAINVREESPMGAHLQMVNTISDNVRIKHPDVKVGTLAYQYTRKPPKTIIPRDNVMVQLCSIECDLLHAYSEKNHEMNLPFAEDLAGWGKICPNLWIWDYIVNYRYYGLPFPNLRSIGENIRYYRNNKVKGVFMEANYNSLSGEMSDLKNYVTSRCLWNPALDSWELTKEFCTLYYQSAAPPILEYLANIHEKVESKKLRAKFNAIAPDVGLDETFSGRMLDKFDEAMRLADNELVKERVERASLCAYIAMIEGGKKEALFKNGKVNFQSSDKYKEALKTFPKLAKKHAMTHYFEEGKENISDIEKELNNELKVFERGGRPAVQLENNHWLMTILNEENGKCVELRNKFSGINLLSSETTDLSKGYFSEYLIKGKENTDTVKFKSLVEKNELRLEGVLKDGSKYLRNITLANDGSGKLICRSTLTNNTQKEKTFQVKVDIYANTGVRERDDSIINASVKQNGKWKQFNAGLIGRHGPHEKLISEGKDGGAFLFFNQKQKAGIIQTFNPKDIDILDASWTDGGNYLNLGFNTKEITLKPGESFSFEYDFKYLEKMP